METQQQHLFQWATECVASSPDPASVSSQTESIASAPVTESWEVRLPDFDSVPVTVPLQAAVEAGVFGVTENGPIEPSAEEVHALTEEQAQELCNLLADYQSVEDALRTGEDPRTGKCPRTPEAAEKLREFLEREGPRLAASFADTLTAFADAFGHKAAGKLDLWVRKTVADCTIAPGFRYDPGHPWHYYHEGDNAPPIPVEDIEADLDLGKYIERDLPKNRTKRAQRIREMLVTERHRVEEDKRRYQEIVERGAEALSRYDREIAHTSDEMARATALSLKYNHIRYGLGRLAWLEQHAPPGIGSVRSFE